MLNVYDSVLSNSCTIYHYTAFGNDGVTYKFNHPNHNLTKHYVVFYKNRFSSLPTASPITQPNPLDMDIVAEADLELNW